MKISSAILSLALVKSAAAFIPASNVASSPALSASTSTSEAVFTDDSVKYNTVVESEPKFKVKDVDPSIFDPKKRVQT